MIPSVFCPLCREKAKTVDVVDEQGFYECVHCDIRFVLEVL